MKSGASRSHLEVFFGELLLKLRMLRANFCTLIGPLILHWVRSPGRDLVSLLDGFALLTNAGIVSFIVEFLWLDSAMLMSLLARACLTSSRYSRVPPLCLVVELLRFHSTIFTSWIACDIILDRRSRHRVFGVCYNSAIVAWRHLGKHLRIDVR